MFDQLPGDATVEEKDAVDPFSNNEIEQFKKDLKDKGNSIEVVSLLALDTGFRLCELLALTASDIDLVNNEVSVSKNIKTVRDIKKDGTHEYKQSRKCRKPRTA